MPHPPEEDLDSPTPLEDVAHVEEIVWAGLFPPPALLREFEAAVPGSADRILRMAEAQHQLSLDSERKRLPANLRTHAVGQVFGGCIALGALVIAGLAIWRGAPWPVPAIALAAVAAGPVPLLIQRLLGAVLRNREENAD